MQEMAELQADGQVVFTQPVKWAEYPPRWRRYLPGATVLSAGKC
jgi:hypothetical protein